MQNLRAKIRAASFIRDEEALKDLLPSIFDTRRKTCSTTWALPTNRVASGFTGVTQLMFHAPTIGMQRMKVNEYIGILSPQTNAAQNVGRPNRWIAKMQ